MSNATDQLKRDFCECVERAAGHRRQPEVFADAVRCMAIALESPLVFGDRRRHIEAEYEQIRARYSADEFAHFPRAFAIVQNALELRREDFLGHALEHIGAANTRNGQFLTPVCVSRMMARASCANAPEGYKRGDIVKLSDPACGSSVLLIEGAEALRAAGVAQGDVFIHAGDIDGRACDISYIQLSLLGYPAIVQHADALAMKRISPDRYTVGYFLHRYPMRMAGRRNFSPVESAPSPSGSGAAEESTSNKSTIQMELFA